MRYLYSAQREVQQTSRSDRLRVLAVCAALLITLGCGGLSASQQQTATASAEQATATARREATLTARAVRTATAAPKATMTAQAKQNAAALTAAAKDACEDGSPTDDAASYDEGGPNLVVAYSKDRKISSYVDTDWLAEVVEEAQIATCLETTKTRIQSCPYHLTGATISTNYIYRNRVNIAVKLIELQTGKTRAQNTFVGATPKTCPSTYKFLIGLPIVNFDGTSPDAAKIKDWIAQRINQ